MTFKERLIEELNILEYKINHLILFRNTEDFKILSDEEKSLLNAQRIYMCGYAEILNKRIELIN